MTGGIPKIAILGGGISGLSLLFYLRKRFGDKFRYTLYEASHRTGGYIESVTKDGVVFEQGPRSIRTKGGHAVLELARELSIIDRVVYANDAARNRFVYVDGQLCALPKGPLDLVMSPIGRTLLRSIFKDLFARSDTHDRSVHDFLSARFSPYLAEVLADAMVAGIYAGDSRKLSMAACFPQLSSWGMRYGSVIRGAFASRPKTKEARTPAIFTFRGGMQTLTDTLREKLLPYIQCDSAVTAIRKHDRQLVVVCRGQEEIFDHVFSCLPAHALSRVLPEGSALAHLVGKIEFVPVAVIGMAFKKPAIIAQGFGYLIPRREGQDNLGVVWDSSVFPHLGGAAHDVLTVMVGGAHDKDVATRGAPEIMRRAQASLEKQMGIREIPALVNTRIIENAIPQYAMGHNDVLDRIDMERRDFSPHFFMLGNSFRGVSVNDCIKNARAQSESFMP